MSRLPSIGGLGSARAVFVAAAVVLAVVRRRRRGDRCGVAGSDAAGAGNGSEPIVEPPTYPDRPTDAGTATILRDGSDDTDADPEIYDDLSAAVDAAGPGDTIELSGVFEPAETVIVDEPGMTIRAASTHDALIDGGGEDTTIAVRAPNATVGVWIDDTGKPRIAGRRGVRRRERHGNDSHGPVPSPTPRSGSGSTAPTK